MTRRSATWCALAAAYGALICPPSQASQCTVPATHGTIQDAVDDPSCANIAIAAGTYSETVLIGRALAIAGPPGGGALITGLVRVGGIGISVELVDLRVENGCPGRGVEVVEQAEVTSRNLIVLRNASLPCSRFPIFGDGFEAGDTSAWSATVP